MKLKNVHLITFSILIILAASVSFVAVQSINNLSELSKDISLQFEQSLVYDELQTTTFQLVKLEKDYIITQDSEELEMWNSKMLKVDELVEQAFTQLAKAEEEEEEEEELSLINSYKQKNEEYRQNFFEIQRLVESGDVEKSSKLSTGKSDILADEREVI